MPCPWLSVSPSVKWKGLVPPSLLGKLKVKIIERAVNRVGVLLASDLPVRGAGLALGSAVATGLAGIGKTLSSFHFFFLSTSHVSQIFFQLAHPWNIEVFRRIE